tara:strand:- start:561 stop:1289 length:729 start_codon:yes stop_codon:yes gene_type:complete
VTAAALCFGLTGIRFAIAADWERAVLMILIAGVLDGVDGRIARMIGGESRFGAELDSLADSISFGVSPAIIMYLWALIEVPKLGWIIALLYAAFGALRLARFNAQIDATEQPHKSAGFLTGVPAPAGAAIAMLPLYLWIFTDLDLFRSPWIVTPWVAFAAFLMVSSIATYSWGSLKLRRRIRFEALVVVAIIVAALVTAPWQTLSALTIGYVVTIPFSYRSYAKVRRQRANMARAVPNEPEQ